MIWYYRQIILFANKGFLAYVFVRLNSFSFYEESLLICVSVPKWHLHWLIIRLECHPLLE